MADGPAHQPAEDALADLVHAERRVALGLIGDAVGELGYDAQLLERSASMPYDTLLVQLPPTADGEAAYQLALTFYPIAEEELSHTNLLQYYIALPVAPSTETRPALLELAAEINNQLVLGHVGLTAGIGQIHFRYVQSLSADEPPTAAAIGGVLLLVGYSLRLFDAALRGVADGSLTIDAARKVIAAAQGT